MDNVYISGNKMLLRILRKKPFPKQMAKWLLDPAGNRIAKI